MGIVPGEVRRKANMDTSDDIMGLEKMEEADGDFHPLQPTQLNHSTPSLQHNITTNVSVNTPTAPTL